MDAAGGGDPAADSRRPALNPLNDAAEQAAADDRWTKWKADGRAHEVRRLSIVRGIVAAVGLGGALWLLLR